MNHKIETRSLTCKLNDEEMAKLGQEQAKLLVEIYDDLERLRESTKVRREEIRKREMEARDMTIKLSTRSEIRDVECSLDY